MNDELELLVRMYDTVARRRERRLVAQTNLDEQLPVPFAGNGGGNTQFRRLVMLLMMSDLV